MFEKPEKGWVVDACTEGNPGLTEYRAIDLETGKVVFHQRIGIATNNIGEFLAVVHAIAEMEKRGIIGIVYTDSQTAISWVKKKSCNTSLKKSRYTELAIDMKDRALKYLKQKTIDTSDEFFIKINNIELSKWFTQSWGEIPADFGRK
jgi:ribonuclease HI